eukprot:m.266914 g.266914  ORF g.266914 m.266914 type:complete len:105 (+) comp17631_c0_seq2:3265-3579(+)
MTFALVGQLNCDHEATTKALPKRDSLTKVDKSTFAPGSARSRSSKAINNGGSSVTGEGLKRHAVQLNLCSANWTAVVAFKPALNTSLAEDMLTFCQLDGDLSSV